MRPSSFDSPASNRLTGQDRKKEPPQEAGSPAGAKEDVSVSSFAPQSFEEAKATFRPLRRSQMKRQSDSPLRKLKASPSPLSARKAQNSAGRPKAKRAKKLSDGKMKKKVWAEFSIYIRTQGADSQGMNQCVTCYVTKPWKELQAGHFIRGRLNANLFDERGVAPQCYSCNVGKQGEVVIYYKWMLVNYGQEVIDELILQNGTTKKWQPGELQSLLGHYKALNDANPLVERKAKNSPRADGREAVAS